MQALPTVQSTPVSSFEQPPLVKPIPFILLQAQHEHVVGQLQEMEVDNLGAGPEVVKPLAELKKGKSGSKSGSKSGKSRSRSRARRTKSGGGSR